MQNEYETKGEVTVRTLQNFVTLMPYLGVKGKVGPRVGCSVSTKWYDYTLEYWPVKAFNEI